MCCPTSAEHPYHTFEIAGGVMADEASELMKLFFRKRRNGEAEVEKPPGGEMRETATSPTEESGATGSGEHERPGYQRSFRLLYKRVEPYAKAVVLITRLINVVLTRSTR